MKGSRESQVTSVTLAGFPEKNPFVENVVDGALIGASPETTN
jgi:hypothetical protein